MLKSWTVLIFKFKAFIWIVASPTNPTIPPRKWHTDTASATKTTRATFKLLMRMWRRIYI